MAPDPQRTDELDEKIEATEEALERATGLDLDDDEQSWHDTFDGTEKDTVQPPG